MGRYVYSVEARERGGSGSCYAVPLLGVHATFPRAYRQYRAIVRDRALRRDMRLHWEVKGTRKRRELFEEDMRRAYLTKDDETCEVVLRRWSL